MFSVDGTNITLSRGDTGAMKITANVTIKGTGQSYTFGENDRALFSIKNGAGAILMQRVFTMTDNQFVVVFYNADTDQFSPGGYSWDVRYVINAYFDENGNIVDGDQVLTPTLPLNMNLLTVVGDI